MKPEAPAPLNPGRVYLCAPVNALVEGLYEEKIPFTQVKQHGDFGLGTFDNLDGEMVMLDGQIYRITAEGRVHEVDEQALTPFVRVTFYHPFSHDELDTELSYPGFQKWLEGLLPSPNIFYALRVERRFASLRVRSVPKQENSGYGRQPWDCHSGQLCAPHQR